ncbi:MAG: DUF1492 domain-containing protein [Ignavibacteriales bacterium]
MANNQAIVEQQTMTNRDKINFLKRYVNLGREIDRKFSECERWRGRMGKITATYSSSPGGGGSIYKNKDLDVLNKIVDIEEEILQDYLNLIPIYQEISRIIKKVKDDRERLLLEYRYLDDYKWEQVCYKMNYCWRQTHNLHSQALKKLNIEKDCI